MSEKCKMVQVRTLVRKKDGRVLAIISTMKGSKRAKVVSERTLAFPIQKCVEHSFALEFIFLSKTLLGDFPSMLSYSLLILTIDTNFFQLRCLR